MSPWKLSRRGRLLPRVALVLGVGAGSLALVELALRSVLPAPDRWTAGPAHARVTFRPDPERMPGVRGLAEHRYDAWGLRSDGVRPGRDPRVLCIGGSTTACDYLDQDESWPARLQSALGAALGAEAWVGNAGRSGLTSRAHVLHLERLAPQIEGLDVVVCLAGVNDLGLALERGARFVEAGLDDPDVRAAVVARAFSETPRELAWWPPSRTCIGLLFERARRTRWARSAAREDAAGLAYAERRAVRRAVRATVDGRVEELPDLGPALAEYRRNLVALAEGAAARGLTLVLATQPVIWTAPDPRAVEDICWYGWVGAAPWDGPRAYLSLPALARGMELYNDVLREVADEHDVPLADLDRELSGDTAAFYDDCHFTEAGAARVAELLADVVGQALTD